MSAQSNYVAKSPYCEHELDPATAVDGWVTCACGRKADAKWVAELGWLQARSSWVAERVSNAEPWFDSRTATAQTATAERPVRAGGGQRLLYTLGALSMIVAVAVFTAVSWERIGATGQVLTLLGLTVLCTAIAYFTRINLVGLANTSAVLASAIAATALYSAPALGLLPKYYGSSSHWYPLAVTVGIGVCSVSAGLLSKIRAWLVVGVPAVVGASLLIVYGMLFDVEHQSYDFTPDWQPAVAVIVFSLGVLALDRYGHWLTATDEANRIVDLFAALGSFVIAAQTISMLLPLPSYGGLPWRRGLLLLVAVVIWSYAALRWHPQPTRSKLGRVPLLCAPYVAAVLASASLSQIVTGSGTTSDYWQLWLSFSLGALLGAALFLAPLYRALPLPKFVLDVTAWSVWYFTLAANASRSFNEWPTPSLPKYPMAAFFALVAAAAAIRWLATSFAGGFITAGLAGSAAIFTFVQELLREDLRGPEPVTLPMAAWLLICMLALHTRRPQLNSGIWLGIPAGLAMLPSAAVAVAFIETGNPPLTGDWIRFWTLLALGVVFTIVGTQRRVTGLLWPGAIAYVLTSFPQLWVDLGLIIPRWMFFAFLGVLLITVAARYERLAQLRRESGSWSKVFR